MRHFANDNNDALQWTIPAVSDGTAKVEKSARNWHQMENTAVSSVDVKSPTALLANDFKYSFSTRVQYAQINKRNCYLHNYTDVQRNNEVQLISTPVDICRQDAF